MKIARPLTAGQRTDNVPPWCYATVLENHARIASGKPRKNRTSCFSLAVLAMGSFLISRSMSVMAIFQQLSHRQGFSWAADILTVPKRVFEAPIT